LVLRHDTDPSTAARDACAQALHRAHREVMVGARQRSFGRLGRTFAQASECQPDAHLRCRSSTRNSPRGDGRRPPLARTLTALAASQLHKKPELTAVRIEPVAASEWFIGNESIAAC
jgi:phenylpyruvate tautomerase PptA (4-oxalocrotonate tautomerase family)